MTDKFQGWAWIWIRMSGMMNGPYSVTWSKNSGVASGMPHDTLTKSLECQNFLFVRRCVPWCSFCSHDDTFLTLLPDNTQGHERWLFGAKLVMLPVSWPRIYGTTIIQSGMMTIVKDKKIRSSDGVITQTHMLPERIASHVMEFKKKSIMTL